MDDRESRRYFGAAWRALLGTRNLFGKLLLLALVQFVPVLGQIVALGYVLGWAREAAWGMETPLPPHVFGMGDDGFWARGAKAFAANVLYALIGMAFSSALAAAWGSLAYGLGLDGGAAALVGALFALVGLAGGLALTALQAVGLVRLAVYDRFGAAFQWGVASRMIVRRFGGLFKIMWTAVLAGLVVAAASLLVALAFAPGIVGTGAVGMFAAFFTELGAGQEVPLSLLAALLACAGILVAGAAVCNLLLMMLALMVQALLWRTLGAWIARFDVAAWGGWHDPLPFEGGREQAGEPAPGGEVSDAGEGGASALQPCSHKLSEKRCHPVLVGLLAVVVAIAVGLAASGLALGALWSPYGAAVQDAGAIAGIGLSEPDGWAQDVLV